VKDGGDREAVAVCRMERDRWLGGTVAGSLGVARRLDRLACRDVREEGSKACAVIVRGGWMFVVKSTMAAETSMMLMLWY